MRSSRLTSFALLAFAALLLLAPAQALAATYTVSTTTDSFSGTCVPGSCTLRQAIAAADGGAGDDVVEVPAGTYGLAFGPLVVAKGMTVEGAGPGATVVDANSFSRAFEVSAAANPASISGLTIENGLALGTSAAQAKGAGILNAGNLALGNVEVRENEVGPENSGGTSPGGGGIYNSGILRITGSSITGNVASSLPQTGGIPSGGGIFNSGSLEITDSVLAGNEVIGEAIPTGGAIHTVGAVAHGASVKLTRVRVEANQALDPTTGGIVIGAGIAAEESDLSVIESSLAGNSGLGGSISEGAGIFISRGNLTIERSLLAGNVAEASAVAAGGGIGIRHIEGGAGIINSTIFGNSAMTPTDVGQGGGIRNEGTPLQVVASTIFGNEVGSAGTGGNLVDFGAAKSETVLRDSIVAGGKGGKAETAECEGEGIASAGHNLVGADGCHFAAAGDRVADPRLAPLAANGGPTQTIALLADSPAIDAGVDCPTVDQRGVARPQGGACDIGAFELESAVKPQPTPPHIPLPAGAAKLKLLGKAKVNPKSGKGTLEVVCLNVAGDRCEAKLTLLAAKPPRSAGVSKAKKKPKLGSVGGTIAGGATAKLKLKLNGAGRALLAAAGGKLRVKVSGAARNVGGTATNFSGKLAVVAKSAKRR